MIGNKASFQIYDPQATSQRKGQSHVTTAIQRASDKTGVDFGYLMRQASVESSMNPNAKARTSSATGLYQFIDQTWLQMMKSHGAEHGYGKYADAIRQTRDGTYYVANKGMRNAVMNLRRDPAASSLMAAELATENDSALRRNTGMQPTSTDLYMAHFMGASGASSFLNAMKKNPWAPAASLFPEAARANRAVFYAQGRPLSLQQVYNNFDTKFAQSSATPVTRDATAIANNAGFGDRVILPLADDWSAPAGAISSAQQTADMFAGAGRGSLRALASDPLATRSALAEGNAGAISGGNTIRGSRVSWPMDVLFDTQNSMTLTHNDRRRYNA